MPSIIFRLNLTWTKNAHANVNSLKNYSPNGPSKVTLQHVANELGLSKSIVSLALRNSPKVKASTKELIHKKAEAMGYRPNPLVMAHMAALRNQRKDEHKATIAFVTEEPQRGFPKRSASWAADYCKGAASRAEELGYDLEVFFLSDPKITQKRLSDILIARGIHGIVFSNLLKVDDVHGIQLEAFALASLGMALQNPVLNRVSTDGFHNMGLALEKLIERDRKRIGYIYHPQGSNSHDQFHMARLAYYQMNLPARRKIPPVPYTEGDEQRILDWFAKYKPDGIIGVSNAIFELLKDSGVSMPEKVSFAGLGIRRRGPSGVNPNLGPIGEAAFDLVVNQLNRNTRGIPAHPRTLFIKGFWSDNGTV